MTRGLGLPLLLVALLAGGFLFTRQSQMSGPTAPAVTRAETQARSYAAATNFQAVAPVLEAWRAANGTYAGAAVPLGSGTAIVRADTTSYCLETTGTTTVMHEAGPNGAVQPGPC